MNYPRTKFSKHLPFLQLSYYHYSTSATCDISGTGGSTIWKYTEVFANDFRYNISLQKYD